MGLSVLQEFAEGIQEEKTGNGGDHQNPGFPYQPAP
jgi:hypothetical protein